MIDSELAQKLVELKFYGEQYDLAIALMCAAKTQQEVVAHWKRSNEFEEKYLCAWDWLTSRGYSPVWSKAEQCYVIDILRGLHGHRLFQNAEEVDAYMQKEHDAWED